MSGGKRPTLNDLANALGLSANTVSRSLAQKDGVSPRTRELVLREAERMGYVSPGPRTRTIALTVTSSTNVFITQLIPAVESALRSLGYTVVLRVTEESTEVEAGAISSMLRGEYAGAIVIPVQGVKSPWEGVSRLPFPVVAVSRDIPSIECDFVGVDARGGMYAATRHLLAGGSRCLLFFDEDLDISTVRARVGGFEDAVSSVSGAVGTVVWIPTRRFESRVLPWQPDEAYRSVLEVVDRGVPFDAMLFADDYYALGAMRALKENGLRVPHDVRIVGYGDHPYSQYLTPSLSTTVVPARVIAEAAVAMLMQRIAGDMSAPVCRLVPAELMVRESSVAVPLRERRGRSTTVTDDRGDTATAS